MQIVGEYKKIVIVFITKTKQTPYRIKLPVNNLRLIALRDLSLCDFNNRSLLLMLFKKETFFSLGKGKRVGG